MDIWQIPELVDRITHSEGAGYGVIIFFLALLVAFTEIIAFYECVLGSLGGFALVMGTFGRKQLKNQKPWYFPMYIGAVIGIISYFLSIIGTIAVINLVRGLGIYTLFLLFGFRIIISFVFTLIANFLLLTFFNKLELSVPKRLASALIIALLSAPYIVYWFPIMILLNA